MGRRVVSGVVLAAIVLGSTATMPTFALVVIAICSLSLWELSQLIARKGHGQAMIFPVAQAAVATYLVLAALGLQHRFETTLLGATLLVTLAAALSGERQGYVSRASYTLFGVIYIGWLGSYFLALRNLPVTGAVLTVAAIVVIAFTDIFAMLVGTTIGRTPLSPISPRKTWEGAVGGLVFASAAGAALGLIPLLHMPWWHGVAIAAMTSVAAQAGDLVESALKRDARVKDAGTLLGGHGGVLDRFDSYTFGGIAFYAALFVTGHIPATHS